MRTGLLIALVGLVACSGRAPFRLRFEDEKPIWFDFEEKRAYHGKEVRLADVETEMSPSGKQLRIEMGKKDVLWFYHFEDDGDPLADRERGFTLTFEFSKLESGTYEFPLRGCKVTFFCDRWGKGYKSALARKAKGTLILTELNGDRVGGWFELELEGQKARLEGDPEPLKIFLSGKFSFQR